MCQNLQTNKRQSVTVDPSKQAGNRRRATENLNKRLRGAMGQVKALVDSIPVRLSVQNSLKANRNTYVWEMSPERQSQVDIRIRQIIDYWFQTQTPERPARWFFNTYINNLRFRFVGWYRLFYWCIFIRISRICRYVSFSSSKCKNCRSIKKRLVARLVNSI